MEKQLFDLFIMTTALKEENRINSKVQSNRGRK